MNALDHVRTICMALPETYEKLSHGAPAFFIPGGQYLAFADNPTGAVDLYESVGFRKEVVTVIYSKEV